MMRWFLLCCVGGLAMGQQLRVRSANAQSVQLEWTAPGQVVLVRIAGTTSQRLAATDQGNYEDKTIDRFGTYRYRILAGGSPSPEVIVGPPPEGVMNAAPLPQGRDPVKYGQASAITIDENGDPAVAFEWADPNGDNDYSDNEVRFVRWSRAAYQWLPAVRVQVVGEIPNQNIHPLSIACERKTGLLAILTPVGDKGASILISRDGGISWNGTPIPGVSGPVQSTALAIADGTVHLLVAEGTGRTRYFSGPVGDISSWKSQPLPVSAGWKQPENVNVALTMDPSGKPVAAWFESQEEGDGHRFEVWRPGGKASTALATKAGADNPDLALTSGAGKLGLLIQAPLDERDSDHGVWYLQSSDGATWSRPSKLPVDGPRTTNPPLDVALDSRGRVVAVFGANSGTDTTACNFPAFSRSNDGVQWRTCGPGKAEGGDFSAQPATLRVIEGENDKAYVLWQETSENKFKQGMLVWHER